MTIDYRMIVEAAPEAIIVYTPEKFLFLNQFAASRLGSDPASLVGEPIMQFVHPESVAELMDLRFADITHQDDVAIDLDQLKRLVKREIGSYHRVKRYRRKSGDMIWVSLGVSAIHDAAGNPIYFIGQMEDITAHREMEEARASAQRRAGIMETTIAIAHEMNNVLTVLMMNAELLAHDASPDEIPEIAAEILGAS